MHILWSNYTLFDYIFQVNIEILLTFSKLFNIIHYGGEKMKLSDLKHYNYLSVYNSIVNGNNTHSKILKDTGISRYTISEITNNLVEKNILKVSILKSSKAGRRTNIYEASNEYYCLFIEKQDDVFSTIGITTNGMSNIRFDFSINHDGLSPQEVFDNLVMNEVKNLDNLKFCTDIYLINGDDIKTNESVIKATKESLIVKSLIDPNKMMLFEINNECIMALYGHIQFTKLNKFPLCDCLKFDEIITIQGNLYFESFNALKIIAMKNIERII